jgi:Immunity protein Imm1
VTRIDDVGHDAVISAIRTLDGHREVELFGRGAWLGIAGGPDQLFIGYSTDVDGQILQALADHPSAEPVQVMVGGQPTTLAPEFLVPPEVAQKAALHFLATRRPSPEVAWERM